MPSTTTTRTRLTAGLFAGGLLLAPVTACSFGSDNVSCTTNSCTVTLSGNGAEADILGTKLAFGGVKDGRATLSVGEASVSCAQGENVAAGPLNLQCTEVTDDSVELTASLS